MRKETVDFLKLRTEKRSCLIHVDLVCNYDFKIRNKVSQIDHIESMGYIKLYELAVSGLYPSP